MLTNVFCRSINHVLLLYFLVLLYLFQQIQYIFELDDKHLEGDIKLAEADFQTLAITDETSLPFLNGAEIEFVKELGASYFKVNNPNAKANCGCGSSFSV